MDVQINNTEQNSSFFSKYFKNIILIFLFIVTIIFLCILFIKYGSNNFLWETEKNKKEPDGIRVKRGIEDKIKELKESERLTLDLDLLEKMDHMEILESRLAQTETELAALKEKMDKEKMDREKKENAINNNNILKENKVKEQIQDNNTPLNNYLKDKDTKNNGNKVSKFNTFKAVSTTSNIYDNSIPEQSKYMKLDEKYKSQDSLLSKELLSDTDSIISLSSTHGTKETYLNSSNNSKTDKVDKLEQETPNKDTFETNMPKDNKKKEDDLDTHSSFEIEDISD